jgi:hypothetical protein
MNRLDIIKLLIKKINAKKFLEIGVHQGYIIDNISCEYKVGVDPNINTKATVFKTSDEFFETNNEKFDVIFIDGLHIKDQVLKDINNALSCLNENGYIVCHDMNPSKEIIQRVPQETSEWTGDCWKAWVILRSQRSDLDMCVVDTDYGCGIISSGQQNLINIDDELNWDNFVLNRYHWLNLIPVQEFYRKYGLA